MGRVAVCGGGNECREGEKWGVKVIACGFPFLAMELMRHSHQF